MCLEKYMGKPLREVTIRVEQELLPHLSEQQNCLTHFTLGLADLVFCSELRDPVPKPEIKELRSKKYYVVDFSGMTRLNPGELKNCLEGRTFQSPYTTINASYEDSKVKLFLKPAP